MVTAEVQYFETYQKSGWSYHNFNAVWKIEHLIILNIVGTNYVFVVS